MLGIAFEVGLTIEHQPRMGSDGAVFVPLNTNVQFDWSARPSQQVKKHHAPAQAGMSPGPRQSPEHPTHPFRELVVIQCVVSRAAEWLPPAREP